MRFGAMNSPLRPILEEIDAIGTLGFDYLELAMDSPEAHHQKIRTLRAEITEALRARAMGLVVHLPTFVYTADLTESIRDVSRAEMLQSMDLAAEMGAEKSVLHPSIISGLGPMVMELSWGYATEALALAVDRAAELGLRLCIENMFPRYRSFHEPDDFVELMRLYPRLEMTLDTGHAHIGAGGRRRCLGFIQKFGNRIGHVHVSDNSGQGDEHLPLGKGTIDFLSIFKALSAAGYDDTVTLEVFSEDRTQLADSRDRLRNLLRRTGRKHP
jgi:sugar phosphate isomerase/epimerase